MSSRPKPAARRRGAAGAAVAAFATAVLLAVSGMLAVLVATAAPAASASRTVKIGASLSAADLTVLPGTTVTWEASDGGEHRVRSTSGPVEFDSGNFTGSWSFTFDTLGSYAYVDHRHESLTGSVTVSNSAPGGGGGGGGGSTPPAPKTASVSLANKAFNPVSVTVAAGGTVTWTNNDSMPHNVTSLNGAFHSPTLNPGQKYSFTFASPGSYGYFCTFHGGMNGTVVVPSASGSTPPPAGGGGGGGGGTTTPPPGTTTVAVSMANKAFSPVSVKVAVGGTVTWTNKDSMPHNVTSLTGAFHSATLLPGQKYSFTFKTPGSYGYFCTFHGGMNGTVVVPSPSGAVPPPAAGGGGGGAGATPGTGAQSGGGGGGAGSKTVHVTLKDSLFSPSSVKANVGDTIVWHNAGAMPHTVTAADKSFDQLLSPGATFTYVLRTQGTVGYRCTFHPGMNGTLVVGAAPAGVTLPPPGASGGTVSGNAAPAAATKAPPPPAAKSDGTKVLEVKVLEMTFEPKMLEAHVGDTVSWVNTGTIPHTVTAPDKSFDRTLAPGERFNYVLRTAGDVNYVCTFHPGMTGMLMVKPALAGVKLPPAGASGDSGSAPATAAVHRHGDRTTYEVQAKDDAFSPALLDVRSGDTVVFVNVGAGKHRVKADDGSFDKTLAPGKRFSVTFDSTGTVRYADPAHRTMFGAVVVRPALVTASSTGPLGGLPLGPAGAVAVLLLVGLAAGARAIRRGGPEDLSELVEAPAGDPADEADGSARKDGTLEPVS